MLTDTMQQVLAEMRNPIPQPKMSFANAVVHVHKDKKCDDVVVEKGRRLRIEGHNAGLAAVEAPLSNLTGRLKKSHNIHESTLRKALPSSPPLTLRVSESFGSRPA